MKTHRTGWRPQRIAEWLNQSDFLSLNFSAFLSRAEKFA